MGVTDVGSSWKGTGEASRFEGLTWAADGRAAADGRD
jgi:hypothetical protein